VDGALAGRLQVIHRKIAVGYGIEAVAGRRGETERARGRLAVDGKTRSSQRRAAQRAFVHPRPRIGKPAAIAPRHLVIGHQVMAQRHRLRGL
jgi:hypothetical protein